jgi:Tfp pilus assembly protein PilX
MRQYRGENQQGIVSIMVATMLIIVASLLVLGLAQVARREARESTDTLLSTQAFYAAETGVNDAKAVLSTMEVTSITPKNTCANQPPYSFNTVLDAANNVEYTCLLINPTPSKLFVTLGPTAQVLPLVKDGGGNIGNLNLSWGKPSGAPSGACPNSSNVSDSNNRVLSPGWSCPFGVLRVDLVATDSGYARDTLLDNTRTIFIVPTTSGSGTRGYASLDRSSVGAANCSFGACNFSITGVNSARSYIRVTEIYKSGGTLTISGNAGVKFTGAQAEVDSTGKAQDVLRRIRVALDISGYNPNASAPGALVSGESICKQFKVIPGDGQGSLQSC